MDDREKFDQPLLEAAGPDIAVKVAFLSRPDSYPAPTTEVVVIETHMSWVFLVGALVYKFKKAVRRDFVDLSTLALRRRNCEDEVRLNGRLAPEVYLGVVPLTLDDENHLHVGGAGATVEWLLVMRRLEQRHMLDVAIRSQTVDTLRLRAVATKLSRFYAAAAPVALSPAAYLQRLRDSIVASARIVESNRCGLDGGHLQSLGTTLLGYVERAAATLAERAAARRIVEGHGDLRPEHVYLGPEPVIIDCLEFSFDLRIIDPVDELAYLGLECEYAGAAWVGDVVLDCYREVSGDDPAPQLVAFYKSARALLRAKLCVWYWSDCALRDRPRWLNNARRYLELACQHAARC